MEDSYELELGGGYGITVTASGSGGLDVSFDDGVEEIDTTALPKQDVVRLARMAGLKPEDLA